ncbi:MAG: DUF1385 domain-containing protein [Desulfovibrionaceae bacterium]
MIARTILRASGLLLQAPSIGGQAVMEGVMMRNGDRLAIAVRKPDGAILVESRPWFSLTSHPWLRKPFVRGFPVLLETLVNGIKALNFSASHALDEETEGELKPWHLVLTLAFSIALALGLFVVVPHLFSLGMKYLGLGGSAETLSFHLWDGFFKLAIFLGYIAGISFIPDIRRVFQYHGAEHKVIWTYEQGGDLTPAGARGSSRLHPRCGTTFLLFVLSIAIILHAVLVPLLLMAYTPQGAVAKHAFILCAKLFMMVPISALAYETIKFAGKNLDNVLCKMLNGPGLLLQLLTTYEPDDAQLEVALASLQEALARDAAQTVDFIPDPALHRAEE